MDNIRFRIRKKGDRYALDKLENTKVIKSWTLNPDKIGKILECPTENDVKVSKNIGESDNNDNQKFAYQILNEADKTDTQIELTPELMEKAKQERDKLLKEVGI